MKRLVTCAILALAGCNAYAQINLKEMVNIEGRWHKKGEQHAYSGDFIETNKKGAVVGKGTFTDGVADGPRIMYYDNGNKELERSYKNGTMDGIAREYYKNGVLKQECMMVDGEIEGTAVMYYETGEKQYELNFRKGVKQGDYFEYAKDGRVLRQFWFVDGVAGYSPDYLRRYEEAVELSHRFENEAAILKYDEAIRLNPTVAQAYFSRGTAKSNNFDFEGAIADYNIAIELDPDYMEAYVNRANAKINRNTTKGILDPDYEQLDGACDDLDKALKLGADKYLIEDMKFGHCKKGKAQKKK